MYWNFDMPSSVINLIASAARSIYILWRFSMLKIRDLRWPFHASVFYLSFRFWELLYDGWILLGFQMLYGNFYSKLCLTNKEIRNTLRRPIRVNHVRLVCLCRCMIKWCDIFRGRFSSSNTCLMTWAMDSFFSISSIEIAI